MSAMKPAESRPSKSKEKLKGQLSVTCGKQGQPKIALLQACMYFVGGIGRLLELATKFYAWWHSDS